MSLCTIPLTATSPSKSRLTSSITFITLPFQKTNNPTPTT
ncbi:hypothetical protein CCACVL1_13599 [Corchorus capsularis]|uniref:Uncharacterized protein n=1 Tax=Corchorus capsularis TaxID=210143 RepID=A0A1R3IAB4_COCAP|nr:hypothetical protein CCACVL1_13599 [Corchorus capsularis]